VKLNELDQYDDAELVRKKTAAMFAGFITRLSPEDNLMGEGNSDDRTASPWRVWNRAPCRSWSRARTSNSRNRPMSARPMVSSCACSSAPWPPPWASPTNS
jgi:hypothetical protein